MIILTILTIGIYVWAAVTTVEVMAAAEGNTNEYMGRKDNRAGDRENTYAAGGSDEESRG